MRDAPGAAGGAAGRRGAGPGGGADPAAAPPPAADVDRLTRRGLRLAQFTVAYNLVEGAVAIGAGLAAGLVSLVGFGVDSGIESAAAVLVWARLAGRLRDARAAGPRGDPRADERREHRALRGVAVTFFLLAAWVTVEGVRALAGGEAPGTSPVGLAVLGASLVVMPLLARAKHRVGTALGGDPLVLADAVETRLCVLLSASTLAGLAAYAATGWTWLDPAAGFVIAAVAVREGREAWAGELPGDDEGAGPPRGPAPDGDAGVRRPGTRR